MLFCDMHFGQICTPSGLVGIGASVSYILLCLVPRWIDRMDRMDGFVLFCFAVVFCFVSSCFVLLCFVLLVSFCFVLFDANQFKAVQTNSNARYTLMQMQIPEVCHNC